MYYCCKGCDDCCRDCCKGCEDCCGEYCDAISECFSTPFSFCTFLASFITFLPFIIMIVAIVMSQSLICEEPIKVHLIIQGINNLLNFLFCVYLMCQYGKNYDDNPHGNHRQHDGDQEYNILQRTVNLILYDFVVCFYIFFLIFFIVWSIIGSNWLSSEPSQSVCRRENNGFLITADYINIYTMWAFLIIGFLVFIYLLIVYSCEDGSCTCDNGERCCCLIMTCGLCDIGKTNKQKYSKQQAQQHRQTYKPSRNGWIHSSKRICGCLSLERKRQPRALDDNSNHHINQMNHNVQMQTYPNQQQYQPRPPQQQKQPGLFDRVKNFFKPESPRPAPSQQAYVVQPPPPPPPQHQYPPQNFNQPPQPYGPSYDYPPQPHQQYGGPFQAGPQPQPSPQPLRAGQQQQYPPGQPPAYAVGNPMSPQHQPPPYVQSPPAQQYGHQQYPPQNQYGQPPAGPQWGR